MQELDQGAVVVTDEMGVPGKTRNNAREILEQIQAAQKSNSVPLTDQRMSRQYKDHARDYLHKIRQQ